MTHLQLPLILSAVLTLLSSCGGTTKNESATLSTSVPIADSFEHRRWITRVAQKVHAGEPLTAEKLDELVKLSREDVIKTLLADSKFGLGVADFGLYYLGFKNDTWYNKDDKGHYFFTRELFSAPQIITAAQEVMHDGDFSKIWSYQSPMFSGPFSTPLLDTYEPAPVDQQDAVRQKYLDTIIDSLYNVRKQFIKEDGTIDRATGCSDLDATRKILGQDVYSYSSKMGFPSNLFLDSALTMQLTFGLVCSDDEAFYPPQRFLTALDHFVYELMLWVKIAPDYSEDKYHLSSLDELRKLPGIEQGSTAQLSTFNVFGFWFAFPNSSTNYNRKRAAYLLKTYFCDDLTPLKIVTSEGDHDQGRHGSDPSCLSCHYKLDPMAGFFAPYGVLGSKFDNLNVHVFDDNAVIKGEQLKAYRSAWPVTGYIRSPRTASANDYGKDLNDLMTIIQKAPEAKQCLIKRMASYYLGDNQAYDGGWMQHLTSVYETAPTSGKGFKDVVSQLLTSKTFTTRDPKPDQCYDYYPSEPGPDAVPCLVRYVIEQNCVTCHKNTGLGELNLSQWVEIGRDANNKPIFGFPHQDYTGQQHSKSDSFAIIAERLNTDDPNRAMPKGKDMRAVDRAALFKWLESAGGQ